MKVFGPTLERLEFIGQGKYRDGADSILDDFDGRRGSSVVVLRAFQLRNR
jgi:hypothetical protein